LLKAGEVKKPGRNGDYIGKRKSRDRDSRTESFTQETEIGEKKHQSQFSRKVTQKNSILGEEGHFQEEAETVSFHLRNMRGTGTRGDM